MVDVVLVWGRTLCYLLLPPIPILPVPPALPPLPYVPLVHVPHVPPLCTSCTSSMYLVFLSFTSCSSCVSCTSCSTSFADSSTSFTSCVPPGVSQLALVQRLTRTALGIVPSPPRLVFSFLFYPSGVEDVQHRPRGEHGGGDPCFRPLPHRRSGLYFRWVGEALSLQRMPLPPLRSSFAQTLLRPRL